MSLSGYRVQAAAAATAALLTVELEETEPLQSRSVGRDGRALRRVASCVPRGVKNTLWNGGLCATATTTNLERDERREKSAQEREQRAERREIENRERKRYARYGVSPCGRRQVRLRTSNGKYDLYSLFLPTKFTI